MVKDFNKMSDEEFDQLMDEMRMEIHLKHNKYFPVYNPISMTYWLVPSEALKELFTKYKCKQIKGE